MRYITHRHISAIELVILLALLMIALALDSTFGVSLFWQFYAAVTLLVSLITIPKFLLFKSKLSLWQFAVFKVALCALHFVVISPEKSFLLLQRDITDGMTINEVESTFSQRFPEQGEFRHPKSKITDGSLWNPYSDKPYLAATPDQKIEYQIDVNNGDICRLIVYFNDGHTVGSEYIPD